MQAWIGRKEKTENIAEAFSVCAYSYTSKAGILIFSIRMIPVITLRRSGDQ